MTSIRNFKFLPLPAIALTLVVLSCACAPLVAASEPGQKYPPTIVFMTDFGVVDDAVAICKGVMYGVMPDVRIVDRKSVV